MNKTGALLQGKPFIFQGALAGNTSKTYEATITTSGHIESMHIKFAAGENGTLHIRPMVIQNGQIPMELVNYDPGLNQFISGDDESFDLKCYMPVENGTKIRIICDNTGANVSFVDVVIVVEYADYVGEFSVIKGA